MGSAPVYSAYDPVSREIYVPNSDSGTVSILNGGCKLAGTVTLPSSAVPVGAAFDPTNNRVYVTDFELDQVYVLSGQKILKTISNPAFNGPYGIGYDPDDARLAVANHGGSTVTFISGNVVTGTTAVGYRPVEIGYDPSTDRLLVADSGSDNVTSLSAQSPTIEKDNINIPVGGVPHRDRVRSRGSPRLRGQLRLEQHQRHLGQGCPVPDRSLSRRPSPMGSSGTRPS